LWLVGEYHPDHYDLQEAANPISADDVFANVMKCDQLRQLSLTGKQFLLSKIPPHLGNCVQLREIQLDLKSETLNEFAAALCHLTVLEELDLDILLSLTKEPDLTHLSQVISVNRSLVDVGIMFTAEAAIELLYVDATPLFDAFSKQGNLMVIGMRISGHMQLRTSKSILLDAIDNNHRLTHLCLNELISDKKDQKDQKDQKEQKEQQNSDKCGMRVWGQLSDLILENVEFELIEQLFLPMLIPAGGVPNLDSLHIEPLIQPSTVKSERWAEFCSSLTFQLPKLTLRTFYMGAQTGRLPPGGTQVALCVMPKVEEIGLVLDDVPQEILNAVDTAVRSYYDEYPIYVAEADFSNLTIVEHADNKQLAIMQEAQKRGLLTNREERIVTDAEWLLFDQIARSAIVSMEENILPLRSLRNGRKYDQSSKEFWQQLPQTSVSSAFVTVFLPPSNTNMGYLAKSQLLKLTIMLDRGSLPDISFNDGFPLDHAHKPGQPVTPYEALYNSMVENVLVASTGHPTLKSLIIHSEHDADLYVLSKRCTLAIAQYLRGSPLVQKLIVDGDYRWSELRVLWNVCVQNAPACRHIGRFVGERRFPIIHDQKKIEKQWMQDIKRFELEKKKQSDLISFFAEDKANHHAPDLNPGLYFPPPLKQWLSENRKRCYRAAWHWGQKALLISFIRANAHSPLKYSIIPLIYLVFYDLIGLDLVSSAHRTDLPG
jgi:hypothetical protein